MNPPKPKRLRRWVSRFALFILLGFVTTIGVAWTIEAEAMIRAGNQSKNPHQTIWLLYHDEATWVISRADSWGRVRRQIGKSATSPADIMVVDNLLDQETSNMRRHHAYYGNTVHDWTTQIPNWGRLGLVSQSPSKHESTWREFGAGFPMLCVWKWGAVSRSGGFIQIPGEDKSPYYFRRAHGLPYLPIPLGLTINTIFWGSAWWLALFGLASFKRRHRTRKGRCANCNYDLAGITTPTCPECGNSPPSPLEQPLASTPCLDGGVVDGEFGQDPQPHASQGTDPGRR